MAGDNVCPRIATGAFATGAAHFLDGPDKRGFDRTGSGVNVVAVEAEACFKTETVARTEADGFDAGITAQRIGEGGGFAVRHGDFVAVFPGVTGAADPALGAEQGEGATVHEGEVAHFRLDGSEDLHRFRPLQGE